MQICTKFALRQGKFSQNIIIINMEIDVPTEQQNQEPKQESINTTEDASRASSDIAISSIAEGKTKSNKNKKKISQSSSATGGSKTDKSSSVKPSTQLDQEGTGASTGGGTSGSGGEKEDENQTMMFRRSMPFLFDMHINHSMSWGSLACAWGNLSTSPTSPIVSNKSYLSKIQIDESTIKDNGPMTGDIYEDYYKLSSEDAQNMGYKRTQNMYFSSRTEAVCTDGIWNGEPAELYVAQVDLSLPNTTKRKLLGRFVDRWKSSKTKVITTIYHPGEVTRIRASLSEPHLIVTHTESKDVYLWDTLKQANKNEAIPSTNASSTGNKQSNNADSSNNNNNSSLDQSAASTAAAGGRKKKKMPSSIPNLILQGHEMNADYALDFFGKSVASGGSDSLVLLWRIDKTPVQNNLPQSHLFYSVPSLQPDMKFVGHTGIVEDVCFNPSDESASTLMSVGRDRMVNIWDSRSGNNAVQTVKDIHKDDINACSWNPFRPHSVLTGGSDCFIHLLDLRKLSNGAVESFTRKEMKIGNVIDFPPSPITNVRWSPHDPDIFASTDEGYLVIWGLSTSPLVEFAKSINDTYCKKDNDGNNVKNELYDSIMLGPSGSKKSLTEISQQYPLDEKIIFCHLGHKSAVIDFQWNPIDPWTFCTVSDEGGSGVPSGGGTLQLWRVSDYIWKDARDEKWRTKIEQGRNPGMFPSIRSDPTTIKIPASVELSSSIPAQDLQLSKKESASFDKPKSDEIVNLVEKEKEHNKGNSITSLSSTDDSSKDNSTTASYSQ